MRKLYLALSACLLILSSCGLFGQRIRGNGHITSQQKNVGSFNSVDVSGAVKVHIRQDGSSSVKLETDENLFEFLEVYTDGNKLVIKEKNGYNLDPTKDIVAYISAPSFADIDVSGACDIIGDSPITGTSALSMHVSGSGSITMEINLPKVSTDISGSGSVNLKGQATDFNAEVSGSGDIKCFDLVTDNTSIDLSGSSGAEVNANKKLDIEISGSADVQYKGSANVNQSISGSGSVKKVG
jgi:hypothetical protein